jgi:hypothetical protein
MSDGFFVVDTFATFLLPGCSKELFRTNLAFIEAGLLIGTGDGLGDEDTPDDAMACCIRFLSKDASLAFIAALNNGLAGGGGFGGSNKSVIFREPSSSN